MPYIGNQPPGAFGVGGPNSTQLNVPPKTITPPAYNVVSSDQGSQLNCNATSGNITVNLPPLANTPLGYTIFIKKTDSSGNAVVVDGSGSETIDGSTTISITDQWAGIAIQRAQTGWISIVSAVASQSGPPNNNSQPGGSFDIGINNSRSITLTTNTLTNSYQYTGSGVAIIHGIYVTNKNDTSEITVDAVLRDNSKAKDFYLCREFPLPQRTSDELIKRPKILQPNDRLRFRTDTANDCDLYIRYSEINSANGMFNVTYEGTINAVGSPETIYTETSTDGSVFESILLTNADGVNPVEVIVSINDSFADPVITNKVNVPAGSSIELCEIPFVLLNGDTIRVEITADPEYLHVTAAGRNI
jgi:hypothetical protein